MRNTNRTRSDWERLVAENRRLKEREEYHVCRVASLARQAAEAEKLRDTAMVEVARLTLERDDARAEVERLRAELAALRAAVRWMFTERLLEWRSSSPDSRDLVSYSDEVWANEHAVAIRAAVEEKA